MPSSAFRTPLAGPVYLLCYTLTLVIGASQTLAYGAPARGDGLTTLADLM
jgi:hypothetical protein